MDSEDLMKITVAGTATRAFYPERAVLRIGVSFQGDNQIEVRENATETAKKISDMIEAQKSENPSPVTWSTVDPVGNSSWRDHETKQRVHQAVTSIQVRYKDFDALSDMIDWCGRLEGVEIEGVDWELSQKTRRNSREAILTDAVRDARERAQVMASAAGGGTVTFVSISDRGYDSSRGEFAMRAMNYGGGLKLMPEDIEVSATVTAEFDA